jgi:hypothetical protein|nr:MAG TPA: hypothetical protein [Caudoviricetes sp.]
MLFSIYKKISSYFICNCLIFKRAEDGAQTRDPQLGRFNYVLFILLIINLLFVI